MNVLILGASGSLGSYVTDELLSNSEHRLILLSTQVSKLEKFKNDRVSLVQADATDTNTLKQILNGVDAVYAGLSGELEKLAKSVGLAMDEAGVKRLVWISSYGIYGEADSVPPASYIKSSVIIENSSLEYTIIRPQWFSSANEINYEVTQKGEKFKNPKALISRKSVAHLVRRCICDNYGIRQSLGINRPN